MMANARRIRLERTVARMLRKAEKDAEKPGANRLGLMWPVTLAWWIRTHPELEEVPRMRRDIAVLKRRTPKKA